MRQFVNFRNFSFCKNFFSEGNISWPETNFFPDFSMISLLRKVLHLAHIFHDLVKIKTGLKQKYKTKIPRLFHGFYLHFNHFSLTFRVISYFMDFCLTLLLSKGMQLQINNIISHHCVWLFYYFNFERNYNVLKSDSMLFVEPK